MEFFNKIIFPYLEKVKEEKEFPKGEHSLVIMDTFKDGKIMIVIVAHNLTNKLISAARYNR